MKHIFTLLFTLIVTFATAQIYPWLGNFYNEIPTREDLWDSSIVANHYHSMTRTLSEYNKKGKPRKRKDIFSFTYDDKGFLSALYETNTRNKKSEKYEYIFKDSVIMGYNYYKNNRLFRSYEIKRNDRKKITDMVKKNSKNEIILKQHNDFDEKGKMLTRIAYFDKNNKEKKAIEYSYFEDDKMKQAKEYRKCKLKRVWNYTCDVKGTEEKKVKEMKVCKNVGVDENGNRVESNRIVNPKGEVELRVNTFDRNERMIKQMVYDDIKHRLKSEWTITSANGIEEISYKYYNKKAKPIMISKSYYNSARKLIGYEYSSGKKLKRIYKNSFEYDNKNLLIHSVGIDKKNRKRWENIHTYN